MSASLYVHAVRAARLRQLARRATRPLRRRLLPRGVTAASPSPLLENEALWRAPAFERLRSAPDGLLAEFSSSYGEDVLESARNGRPAEARAVLDRWVDRNPPRRGTPWHPYVVSTRIGNWVAAIGIAPELGTASVGESLRRQLVYLRRNVEDDILGNHVIRNAKALLLGGLAVRDDDLARLGRRLLARELPEQILPDGGHYERSPAYHRLVLRDLLEVRAFTDVEDEVARMESFAAASSRPDGAPALFNDGGLDLAPALELQTSANGLDVRPDTGYAFLRRQDVWLAFDCGVPGPPFLPAHAHADALSFQLWIDGRPAVVDPGTSTYEPGLVRAWERGTESHSTVAAGGDQFRVWGSFRSGPLPRVHLVEADETRLVGEAHLPSGIRFRRCLTLGARSLIVEDSLDGRGSLKVVSSIPLAPCAPVEVRSADRPAEVVAGSFAERFGEHVDSTAVVQRANVTLPWTGGWEITWGGAAGGYSGGVAPV